jgi:predicted membrane protein
MKPDNMHFHHKLNERFHNQRIAVLLLSLAQLVFAGLGLLIYFLKAYLIGWILLGVLALVLCAYTIFFEKREKKKITQASE